MNCARRGQRYRFDAELYVIARRQSRGPELMRLPYKAGEALTVFTVWYASDSFLRCAAWRRNGSQGSRLRVSSSRCSTDPTPRSAECR
jgi:hypothetical protein